MAKFTSKGQVATEYMLLIGFLLAIVGVASAYALFFYIESFKVSEARNTVTLLAETADQVYAWGPGNALTVNVTLPSGVQEICVKGNLVRLRLSTAGGDNYATGVTIPKLTPNCALPTAEGRYTFRVAVVDNNVTFTEV